MWDVAIAANLGGGRHFCVTGLPSGVFTNWVKIFGTPVFWLETVKVRVLTIEGMMRGFEHPVPLVSAMPLVLAQQFLLWLCS